MIQNIYDDGSKTDYSASNTIEWVRNESNLLSDSYFYSNSANDSTVNQVSRNQTVSTVVLCTGYLR